MDTAPVVPPRLFVPTPLEAALLTEAAPDLAFELCGFGLVAAAASSAASLARSRPPVAYLIGIAGTYDNARLPIGSASWFSTVAVDGIGVGSGVAHQSAESLGFSQLAGDVDGRLDLADSSGGQLLSVAAASANAAEAAARRERFPAALAEDMEGFAVALAGRLNNVPVRIVRGLSNLVGERDRNSWRVREALRSAVALLRLELEAGAPGGANSRQPAVDAPPCPRSGEV